MDLLTRPLYLDNAVFQTNAMLARVLLSIVLLLHVPSIQSEIRVI
jgi:hypothetical protein